MMFFEYLICAYDMHKFAYIIMSFHPLILEITVFNSDSLLDAIFKPSDSSVRLYLLKFSFIYSFIIIKLI